MRNIGTIHKRKSLIPFFSSSILNIQQNISHIFNFLFFYFPQFSLPKSFLLINYSNTFVFFVKKLQLLCHKRNITISFAESAEQEVDSIKPNVITLNCTVAYMAQCMSYGKCKDTCQSMGATSYRWFHDGCCECVGEHCINYGINESRYCIFFRV